MNYKGLEQLINELHESEDINFRAEALLTNFVDEQIAAISVTHCCESDSEPLRFLIDKFQTPKGNYLIDLLMARKEETNKKP